MGLTRLDCSFFRGGETSLQTSSYMALNPSRTPGSLVFAGAAAVKDSVSSQVACRLALDHYVSGVLEFFERLGAQKSKTEGSEEQHEKLDTSLNALEAAFKNANTSVYNFGHKLAAGGRMAASLLGLVIQGTVIAAGRVGVGSAYLYRQGELFPFFENSDAQKNPESLQTFVGANSVVSVELASVPLEPSDLIVVFSSFLDAALEKNLTSLLSEVPMSTTQACDFVAKRLFEEPQHLAFGMTARLGPECIYLCEVVEHRGIVSTII